MSDEEWTVLEDDIADALTDSLEMDWTVDVGARAVIEMLRDYGYELRIRIHTAG
jgi:hypothetical protein